MPEIDNLLSVIIGVMDKECCIVCFESFENDLDPAIQYLTNLTRTSVTNNFFMHRIEGVVVFKKATSTYQHP